MSSTVKTYHPRLALHAACACLLLLAAATMVKSASAAEMALLDGRQLSGSLVEWNDGNITFATDEQSVEVSADEILRIRFAAADAAEEPAGGAASRTTATFVDGSVLPFDEFTVKDDQATLSLAGGEQAVTTSTKAISEVHLQPPSPAIAAQWNAIREADEAGDLIVIRREDAAIDYVAGRIGDVTESQVFFFLDEEQIPVARAKVDGLLYFHAQEADYPDPLCTVHTRHGEKLLVRSVALQDDVLQVTTHTGMERSLPLGDVSVADFSAGKVVYLTGLRPRSTSVTPLLGLPESSDLVQASFEPRFGGGFFAEAAQLRYPKHVGDRRVGWELKTHHQVLALRSRSEIVYDVPEGVRRLRAVAGIDAALGGEGNVRLSIYGDGNPEPLFEQTVAGDAPPVPLELDIEGVHRLRIVVDYGEGGDVSDRLYLCEAKLIK